MLQTPTKLHITSRHQMKLLVMALKRDAFQFLFQSVPICVFRNIIVYRQIIETIAFCDS